MRRLLWGTLCLLALAGTVPAAALATPVLWTVAGDFGDGGRVDGTFVYDADGDAYGEISLKTTAGSRGSPFFGAVFDSVEAGASNSESLRSSSLATLLELSFAPRLTSAGGSVLLSAGSETLTSGVAEGAVRRLISGRATGVPVPEPSTATLFALGLTSLAALRRFGG